MTGRAAYLRAWRARPDTRERLSHGLSRYTVGCRCDVCRAAVSAWRKRDRISRAARGLCANCSHDALPDRARCASCLKRARGAS
jgi:hypothetical protein